MNDRKLEISNKSKEGYNKTFSIIIHTDSKHSYNHYARNIVSYNQNFYKHSH